ncbi:protein TEX261 [Diorhabda carinulata]|uniref:protein TEX261 n=1 Tax=Diorhabda sublineata TaxID=1163346 RepID=UPI0024E0C40A|nr:protein TEX261 [Diorhabda sublineata]XP_057665907.1 protein TEX261 [Diorhabda carinulata]
MWFLTLVTYIAIIIQIIFVTIAIAAGLYYLAELVEEYTSVAKKFIWWLNAFTFILYLSLWIFERFPTSMIVCGLLAQVTHFVILRNFPFVAFLSIEFVATVLFILINHYLAFSYFATVYHTFSEVIAYFTLFLWLVPFALFVSLSANDNVLPTSIDGTDADVVSNYFSKKNKKFGLLAAFNYAKDTLLPVRTKKGF